MACDSCRNCRSCNIEKYPFDIDGHNFTGSEMIHRAEIDYGCQVDSSLKMTSKASWSLRANGHIVKDRRKEQ